MYSRILVAIDPDQPPSWGVAIPAAVALASCFSARLTICSVVRDAKAAVEAQWSSIGYREMIDLTKVRLAKIASAMGDMPIDVEVGTGTICAGILDVAGRVGADLIILASHIPGMTDRLWAGNAARVARRAECSVLVVRS